MTPLLSTALLATQSDERLLELAQAGHDRAFEAIVERYRRPLARYLRRLLSGPLAEDVLQATFVNAWRSLGRGTEVRDLRPWLYRIAHNQAVNALSRAEPRLAGAEDAQRAATVAGPEAEVEHRDVLARALTAISALPDRQRAALVAVAVEDRPHPDVARELGLTEGALRQLVHRARTTLRAAATAVVPLPLVTAAIGAAQDSGLGRIAEVAAGAGGAGLGVKTGAALLAAGALAVGGPTVHEERAHRGVGLDGTAQAATLHHRQAAPKARATFALLAAPTSAATPATHAPRAHRTTSRGAAPGAAHQHSAHRSTQRRAPAAPVARRHSGPSSGSSGSRESDGHHETQHHTGTSSSHEGDHHGSDSGDGQSSGGDGVERVERESPDQPSGDSKSNDAATSGSGSEQLREAAATTPATAPVPAPAAPSTTPVTGTTPATGSATPELP